MYHGKAEMRLLTGTAHPELAKAIADYIGVPLGDATVSSFPDGETFVKINENVRGRDVFIIQPTCPPTNHNLMELLILVDAARRASAARITAVIPFFGYARQDRKDQPRVPITAKLVANLIAAAGVNRLLTMDLHAQQLQGFFDIPVDHLYALPVLIKYLQQKNIPDLVVVSPDVGGVKMASAYSQVLGAGLAIVVKRRISATETEAQHVIGDVKGKNVLLVDDLTETAGTLVGAAKILRAAGSAQDFGRSDQRSGCLGEIVDEEDILSLHIADDVLRFSFGRADASLDHDGQAGTEHLRVSGGHFYAAHVG